MLADAAAAAAASKPAAGAPDDEDDIEDEIGYVDVRPAPEDSDDDDIVDEVGVVERSELSVTASSIPEESIALHRGSSRSKSSSDAAAAGEEPSPTRSEDSLDGRYEEVTAKHEDVQRRLRARQRELRAAELAAKQMKIREMEEELARLERIDAGASLADEAAFEADIAGYDVEDKLRAHQERLARLEETVEARRLEALALRKMKSVELELTREIHTLDSDIERIGRTDGREVPSGSPSRVATRPSPSPVKTLRTSPTRGAGRPSSPSPEPDVVGEEHIPEESIADLASDGGGSDDAFRPGSQSTGGLGGTSRSPPTRSPRSSTGSDASGGHHPHSPLELHPPAHAVISPPKKKGVGVPGGSNGGGSKRTSPGSSSVSEIPSPETSIHTDAYSEDDFEADGTESAASSRARSAGSTGESPSLSGEAESLLGVLHSHLLGEALDDVAAAAFSKPIAEGRGPAVPSPPAVPPPAAVDDLVRLATATRAASIACLIIERCGADVAAIDFGEVAGDIDPRGLVGGGLVGGGLAAVADAASRRRCPDRLVFDAVREVMLESSALVGAIDDGGDRATEVVAARAAAVLDPPHGGRLAVDDVVKDDVRASDDEGWYDVVSTERAILTRLSEELFDDVVEDTVLALMFESR
jgi:hypothetical protein